MTDAPSTPHVPPPTEARDHVAAWVAAERAGHADRKFSGSNRAMVRDAMAADGLGDRLQAFVANYMRRAELVGLDTLQGRQALGKAAVTLLDFCEHAVILHGPMPAPGVPSGEIAPWEAV